MFWEWKDYRVIAPWVAIFSHIYLFYPLSTSAISIITLYYIFSIFFDVILGGWGFCRSTIVFHLFPYQLCLLTRHLRYPACTVFFWAVCILLLSAYQAVSAYIYMERSTSRLFRLLDTVDRLWGCYSQLAVGSYRISFWRILNAELTWPLMPLAVTRGAHLVHDVGF